MPTPGALTAPPIVLLTLEYAGRTWRHSSRPVDITDGATVHHYRGGLAASDVYLEAPFLATVDASTMPVDVLATEDLAALVAQGHILADMRGEVALYREGDDFSMRDRKVDGRAEVESGGYLGRPLRLTTVGDSPVSQPGVWPPPDQALKYETWSNSGAVVRSYDEDVEGAVYPQVLGQAGSVVVSGTRANVAATPVYSVSLDAGGVLWDGLMRYTPWGNVESWAGLGPPRGTFGLVSAGMLYPGPPGAHQGEIFIGHDDGTGMVWKAAWLYYAYDLLGQIVTLARLQDAISDWGSITPGRSYYAAITPPCSGIARRDWRGGLEGAGEICRWALEQSAIRIDWRRTGAVLPRLDRYRIAGFWDQSCDSWGWVCDNVLPLLPVTWVAGPDGLYPVAWRLEATADSADLELTDGIDCTIEGEPKTEGTDDVRSRHVLDYAHSLHTSTYPLRVTAHGSPPRETVRESITPALRRAQLRWGSSRGSQALALDDVASTEIIYDNSTAWRVLGWRSQVYSEPRTVYHLVAPHHSRLARVEPGMVLALTSTRYSLSRRVLHVTRAGWLGGMCYCDAVAIAEVR